MKGSNNKLALYEREARKQAKGSAAKKAKRGQSI